jgi:hypothetical protein
MGVSYCIQEMMSVKCVRFVEQVGMKLHESEA